MTKKKIILTFFAVLASVIVVVVLSVLFLIKGTNEQVEISKTFVSHLAAAEYDAAYTLTSSAFQGDTSLEELQGFVEYYKVVDNTEEVKFTYRGVTDGIYTFSGTLYAGEETSPVTVEVVEENSAWKISFFSIDPIDVPNIE